MIEIQKGTIKRIERIISDIYLAIEAIERGQDSVLFRGRDTPLSYACIDLFYLDDALIVLNHCIPTLSEILEWEKERTILYEKLWDVIQKKYRHKEWLPILRSSLENRIEDLKNYVSVLPKNISPDGDGFGNLLAKRHSIEALLQTIEIELGENPYTTFVEEIDQILKSRANPLWLPRDSTCQTQLLELAPRSRWWFYPEGYC